MTFFTGFKQGMNGFGRCITVIVNSILLSLVYIIGVGLTAIAARIHGKKFLHVAPDPQAKTYWEDLNLKKRPIKEHYRQF